MKILIIDDHYELADLWRTFFAPLNVPVEIAGTMEEGIAAMRKVPPPDLIFLDLWLPDTDSAEATLRNIVTLRKYNPNAVVVVVSGMTGDGIAKMALVMGADEFFHKLQMDSQVSLFRAVKSVLEKRRDSGQKTAEAGLLMIEALTALLTDGLTPVNENSNFRA